MTPTQHRVRGSCLWTEAVAVAAELGAYQSARILAIDYRTLKRRLERRARAAEAGASGLTFVEVVNPLATGTVAECVLTVERAGGCTVRLEMKGVPPQGLVTLVQGLGV